MRNHAVKVNTITYIMIPVAITVILLLSGRVQTLKGLIFANSLAPTTNIFSMMAAVPQNAQIIGPLLS